MAVFSAITAGAGLISKAGAITKGVSNFLGLKSDKRTDCGSRQLKAQEYLQEFLTDSDRARLVQDHKNNVGRMTGTDWNALAFHYLGGVDCKVNTTRGRAWVGRVDRLVKKRASEQKSAGAGVAMAQSSGLDAILNKDVLIPGGFMLLAGILLVPQIRKILSDG